MPKAKRKTPKKLTPKKRQYRQAIALVLIIVGLNAIFLGGLSYSYRQLVLSFQVAPQVTAPLHIRKALPTKITVANVGIDLPVEEAQIINGIWQTSDQNATHLDTSANPGEGGNVVIYGHNRKLIFAALKKVAIGDRLSLETKEGKRYEYVVNDIQVVNPSQVELVLPTDYEVLTVYTCTGLFDSQRLVIRAIPTRVSSL